MDDGAIIIIVLAACTSAVFVVRAIASAVLRMQEMQLKHRSGSGLLAGMDDSRLQRIEQAIDSIAVEVERISENQRFTTKLLSERSGPDSGRT